MNTDRPPRSSTSVSLFQEPPEDEANIIEKILSVRIAKKEVKERKRTRQLSLRRPHAHVSSSVSLVFSRGPSRGSWGVLCQVQKFVSIFSPHGYFRHFWCFLGSVLWDTSHVCQSLAQQWLRQSWTYSHLLEIWLKKLNVHRSLYTWGLFRAFKHSNILPVVLKTGWCRKCP